MICRFWSLVVCITLLCWCWRASAGLGGSRCSDQRDLGASSHCREAPCRHPYYEGWHCRCCMDPWCRSRHRSDPSTPCLYLSPCSVSCYRKELTLHSFENWKSSKDTKPLLTFFRSSKLCLQFPWIPFPRLDFQLPCKTRFTILNLLLLPLQLPSILFPKRNCSFLANGMFTNLQQLHNKQRRILQQMDNQQQLPDTKFTKVLF